MNDSFKTDTSQLLSAARRVSVVRVSVVGDKNCSSSRKVWHCSTFLSRKPLKPASRGHHRCRKCEFVSMKITILHS